MTAVKSAFSRALRLQSTVRQPRVLNYCPPLFYRQFHATNRLDIVKPFLLADIGEGITECQLIQWFVQPGARVEQFDKICEVQSDKASVEITSPFDGVIKKLYYEPDDMAITGKPLVDIDIESEISAEDEAKLAGGAEEGGGKDEGGEQQAKQQESKIEVSEEEDTAQTVASESAQGEAPETPPPSTSTPTFTSTTTSTSTSTSAPPKGDKGTLATPAVRRLTKEHNVNVADVEGTGKDGRVLKEDVNRHVSQQGQQQQQPQPAPSTPTLAAAIREDRKVPLTPVQNQMFKTMTKALNIPHFLYTCAADMTATTDIRKRLNAKARSPEEKLTTLPFILKALSLALQHHPLLNSSLNASDSKKPELTYRGAHNFGVAIDAPSGLLVPVVKNVQDLSITEISSALRQLSEKARNNQLAPSDFSAATFTVSNIGSVGGGVVGPVISEPQVAILGIGRSKMVPAFDENDELVKKEELVLSWSADHRVVDGAECARCAEKAKGYLEDPGSMVVGLR